MKIESPRFVAEYKNFVVNCTKSCELMEQNYKTEKIEKAEKVYRMYCLGYISVSETMKVLSDI